MTGRPPIPLNPRFQATIREAFVCAGAGLHTGRRVSVRVSPAAAGHGVVFRRSVDGRAHDVPALWPNRRSRPLCTALQVGDGPLVRTVEHLLAALSALRLDNALVEIDAEELPIFDGSALPWTDRLIAAGRRELDAPRRYLRVLRPVACRDGVHKGRIEPGGSFSLSAAITLSHFGRLRWEGQVDAARFVAELAPSRSFGRLKWALATKLFGRFRQEPVLRGATFANTAALWGADAVGGLRAEDEPVRHRALDLVGDLALAGYPLLARVSAVRPGHDHNFRLLHALMTDHEAWDVVEYDEHGRTTPPLSDRAA